MIHSIHPPKWLGAIILSCYLLVLLLIALLFALYPIGQARLIWQVAWAGALVYLALLIGTLIPIIFPTRNDRIKRSAFVIHFSALFLALLIAFIWLVADGILHQQLGSLFGALLALGLLFLFIHWFRLTKTKAMEKAGSSPS